MNIRAAVHVHSDWSYDGRWPLPRLAKLFSARGYNAVLLAEHDRGFDQSRLDEYRASCAEASNDGLLLVPGIEYSDPDNVVHITAWGTIPFLGEGRSTDQLLARISDHGGAAFFAHPSRRGAWRLYRKDWNRHLLGIELWNRKTDGWAPSSDAMNLLGQSGLQPIAAMDFHTPKQLFPLAMRAQLVGNLSEASVLGALAGLRFRCEAFGRSLDAFTRPLCHSPFRAAEAIRRQIARTVRALRVVAPNAGGTMMIKRGA